LGTGIKNLLSKADRPFFGTLLKLALPISLQQMLTASMAMIDVLMVSSLGTIELASVGLISKMYFVTTHILNGLGTGASILTAQYFGKSSIKGINETLGLAILFSFIFSFPIALASYFFPSQILSLLTSDTDIVKAGVDYVKITAVYHVLTGFVVVISSVTRSIRKATLPMLAGVLSIASNTVLNYILIYGKLGLPAMGLKGAGIATILSRLFELLLLIWGINHFKIPLSITYIKKLTNWLSVHHFKKLVYPTLPLMINELAWSMGIFSYFIIFGHIGRNVLASMSLLIPFEGVYIEFFVGFGIACSIWLGNLLGSGAVNKARETAYLFLLLIPLASLILGGLVLVFKDGIMSLFIGQEEEVINIGKQIIIIMALVLPIRMFNMTTMMGILRSGGDTKYVLMIDASCMWGLGVPMAAFCGLALKLPFEYVYPLMMIEELVKMTWSYIRVRSGKWAISLVNKN